MARKARHTALTSEPVKFTRTWWPSHGYSVTGWDERGRLVAIVSVRGPSRPHAYLHQRWASRKPLASEIAACRAEWNRLVSIDHARQIRMLAILSERKAASLEKNLERRQKKLRKMLEGR